MTGNRPVARTESKKHLLIPFIMSFWLRPSAASWPCLFLLLLYLLFPAPLQAGPLEAIASDRVDMSEPDWIEHLFGPTDIHGVAGNGNLAVGINDAGTVSVLKWPRPSFHDQLRYRTRSRELPRLGARENDGLFFGLILPFPRRVLWLRDADVITQQYLSNDSNLLQTDYRFQAEALAVQVVDFVPDFGDALIRTLSVSVEKDKALAPIGVVAFANLSLCRRKLPYAPVADWLFDTLGEDTLLYDKEIDALIQTTAGQGGDPVAAAMGFFEPSGAHQCGVDGGRGTGGQEALSDAQDGRLSGSGFARGRVDGALAVALNLDEGSDRVTFFIAFGSDALQAGQLAMDLRSAGPEALYSQTLEADREWVSHACLPDTDDLPLLNVARRALLLTQIVTDPRSGAIGASVATQPPYAPDWSRDGAYVNLMLDKAGMNDAVTAHNLFYAKNQRWPLGNWDMCVYGDGVPAGPLFLELDTLGLTTWTLWDHVHYLDGQSAEEYLDQIYPAIAAAADFFLWWKDPATGLPLPAFESDFVVPKSTLLSAGAAWATLRYAIEAGNWIGEAPGRLARWEERQAELTGAIYEHYFDDREQVFVADPYTLAYMIYPFEFLHVDDPRIRNTAEAIWEFIRPILDGETNGGSYLGLLAISLAKAWQEDKQKEPRLEALMDFLINEQPLPGTLLYGECFVNLGDRVETRTGIPHVMGGSLTFIAAGEIYGITCPEASDDEDDDEDDDDDDDDGEEEDADGETEWPGIQLGDGDDETRCCG